jgi:GT2 family glycosyltransferase
MQIEVVDDCSMTDDPAAVVADVGAGRVGFHRNPANLGATATFNVCLQRARGRWVHILHGDDQVLPGFYAECHAAVLSAPEVIMVLGPVVTIDDEGRWMAVIGPQRQHAGGIFTDFLRHQAVEQLAQFAGVVVRRDAYESAGGFCTLFGHVADLDMWFRLGQLGPVWCTGRPYGLFRVHAGSDSGRQMISGANIRELYLSGAINLGRLAVGADAPAARRWRRQLARRAYRAARKLDAAGSSEGRLNQARWAFGLSPTVKTGSLLVTSWLRHTLRPKAAAMVQRPTR